MATGSFECEMPSPRAALTPIQTCVRDAWKQFGSVEWMKAGTKLCVAADLDVGTLRAAVTGPDGAPLRWIDIKGHGVSPGAETGSNLFPTVSGKGGASIKCNFGSGGEMLHKPPSTDYNTLISSNESNEVIYTIAVTSTDILQNYPLINGGIIIEYAWSDV